ncbi:MAG: hypothetical protein ACRC8S_13380 [Fimbriiglobus sp.]
MEEFVCVTVLSEPGESEAAFKSRLTAFWTHMLRQRESTYEQVYSEATKFEADGDQLSRQYMVMPEGVEVLEAELKAAKIGHETIDVDDTYNKYEASGAGWFQLDHD